MFFDICALSSVFIDFAVLADIFATFIRLSPCIIMSIFMSSLYCIVHSSISIFSSSIIFCILVCILLYRSWFSSSLLSSLFGISVIIYSPVGPIVKKPSRSQLSRANFENRRHRPIFIDGIL